jgi:phospholipid-binding lipoprotein MlaA
MTSAFSYGRFQRAVGCTVLCALLCASIPATAIAQSGSDPLQGLNRKTHAFNEGLDRYLLRPVARGWSAITPELLRESLRNFDNNIRFPVVVANDILQWKWRAAAEETARFAVNTTVGILGLRDPASGMGLELQLEDMGQTLAVWGVPAGPYVVLPLFGPSNPRDAVGLLTDSFLSVYWVYAPFYASLGYGTLNVVNRRALADRDIETARKASLDFYVFLRDAYGQRRAALIRDMADVDAGEGLYEIDDDPYEFDEDDEEESD